MDIDALLEAFQDFEKKAKKEPCPVLEQFLCHVAKTGQPLLSWSQFKTYFLFKLENVMDDFHASAPEQRGLHNPNVEYITFEEMKTRILKIVDGYNGIPFTIQRLCELLTDPKRNYTGTDKFLRGLEKNVMVVSCVYPASEKNGASSVNRMNGVMFPGNSSYSECRNVNGPGTLKTLCRPKLSLSSSLSTNGLPDCPISKESEPITEEEEEQRHISDSEPTQSDGETTASSGIKNKHAEEEEEEDCDGDKQEAKRLKFERNEEDEAASEDKESSSLCMAETPEPSEESCGPDDGSETPCDTSDVSDHHETTSAKTDPSAEEEEGDSCEATAAVTLCPKSDSTADQSEQPSSPETRTSLEQDGGDNSNGSSGGSSDGEGPNSDKQTPSSSNSPDSSTEGAVDASNQTELEPGEHD